MRDHSLGEFQELVLLVVAALHEEAYGVAILKYIEKETDKKMNISAIHVALKRMEEKGFVNSAYGGITKSRGGRRKKYYTITAFGKQVLDRQFSLRSRIYHRIPKLNFGS